MFTDVKTDARTWRGSFIYLVVPIQHSPRVCFATHAPRRPPTASHYPRKNHYGLVRCVSGPTDYLPAFATSPRSCPTSLIATASRWSRSPTRHRQPERRRQAISSTSRFPASSRHSQTDTQSTFWVLLIAISAHQALSLACFVEHRMPHLASQLTQPIANQNCFLHRCWSGF